MKQVLIAALICLCSCHNDKTQTGGYSEVSRMQAHTDTSTVTHSAEFDNRDQSSVKCYSAGNITAQIRNVSYSIQDLSREHALDDYVVKQTKETKVVRGEEGTDSRITLDIFSIPDSKLIRTIRRQADEIQLSTDFLEAIKYGDLEKYCELSEIWRDSTFLAYNDKYFLVEIPNSRMQFYLGYSLRDRDEDKLVHGELHFSHRYTIKDTREQYSASVFRAISRLVFRVKSRAIYERLLGFCPEITLLKHTDQDKIVDHPEYQELELWSYNGHQGLDGINLLALKLTFQDDTTFSVTIPIENGLLYGDNSPERTVYIDQ